MKTQAVPGYTEAFTEMASAAEKCRMIFFSGLPATGKSLFLQQQALLAAEAGRQIHFMRWDIALAPFQADESAAFFVPVPTNEVRSKLVAKRQASINNPRHSDEKRDAPMQTLENVWLETCSLAFDLGLVDQSEVVDSTIYDSTIYQGFFQHMLRHRNCRILAVEEVNAGVGSAHDFDVEFHELLASADEVAECMALLETNWNIDEITRSVENWYKI